MFMRGEREKNVLIFAVANISIIIKKEKICAGILWEVLGLGTLKSQCQKRTKENVL